MDIGKDINILEKILNMREEFEELRGKLLDEEERYELNIFSEMRKIDFIQEKLKLLNIGILDNESKSKCMSLIKDIEEFKNNQDFKEDINKIEVLEMLRNLTNVNNNLNRLSLADEVMKVMKSIHLTEDNIYEILDNNLVYSNSIGDYERLETVDIDWDERMKYSKELLDNLFYMVSDSYNKSKKSFDIYEKIMVINILETVRKNLLF